MNQLLQRLTPALPLLAVIGAINANRPGWLGAFNEVVALVCAIALGFVLRRRPGPTNDY